jgi:Family of unknown function (DUF6399)/Stage III sporulation protein D
MLPNIRERSQKVADYLQNHTKAGIETIAQAIGVSKSSVHRHQQAISDRNQYPESALWETEVGHQWLIRLVLAVLYHFGIKQGIGADSLSAFLSDLRLDTHVGISASALRQLEQRIAQAILDYEAAQAEPCQGGERQGICLGADETFFGLPILVLIELASGFIFTEVSCENRQYETWLEQLSQWWNPEQWTCHFLVSDGARALVKLAVSGLSSVSVADLFHALRALGRPIGNALSQRLAQVNRQIRQVEAQLQQHPAAEPPPTLSTKRAALSQQQQQIEADQHLYHQTLEQISQLIHPFHRQTSAWHSHDTLVEALTPPLALCKQLGQTYGGDAAQAAIETFESQISSWSSGMEAWRRWTTEALQSQTPDPAVQDWVLTALLPWVYWSQHAEMARKPQMQLADQQAASLAFDRLFDHPMTLQRTAQEIQQWVAWCQEMAANYQRTSSAVEGRNGYLSQRHHANRGFSAESLKLLTIIHNFDLRRADGTTAAQRLFGHSFPDLFEWVLNHVGDLPLPRRSSKALPA